MDQSMIRTSWKQRVGILLIAIALLASTVAIWIAVLLGNNSGTTGSTIDSEYLAQLEEDYTNKMNELNEKSQPLSDQYFDSFVQYKSEVSAYNTTAANEGGLQIKDLKEGDGEEITGDGPNYLAYYIGWCGDSSIFDASLDDTSNPTYLTPPIPTDSLIAGWAEGVIGMKIGGVRELTIPGELAYGETQEICNDTNSPLKFVVQAVPFNQEIYNLWTEVQNLNMELYYAQLGIKL